MAIKVTRNKTTKEMTFSDILKSSRGRAWIIIKEINYNKKSEYFMEYFKGLYPKGVTWKKLKEPLTHHREDVFEHIGISI